MGGERYVLLGLAHPRSTWFRSVTHWANAASIPAEFVKCVSVEEVRARLGSGRPFSALLVDGGLPGLDRDLLDLAQRVGCAVLVVGRNPLGSAALAADFDRSSLMDALASTARLIGRGAPISAAPVVEAPIALPGRLLAVCGPGGTGASTVAVALAQAAAAQGDRTLLADLRLHAEQAALHDTGDVVPGLQELVDAFRNGRPSPDELRSLTWAVPARGYDLLLGLRQARAWATLRPRALEAATAGLLGGWATVVCDVGADVEGERDGGSLDVEERNAMARTALGRATGALVVGAPGMKGVHSLVRVIDGLRSFGVPPERMTPVLNRAGRPGRHRNAWADAVESLSGGGLRPAAFLPERDVDGALRDGVRLGRELTEPLLVGLAPAPAPSLTGPERVEPGSLVSWDEEAS